MEDYTPNNVEEATLISQNVDQLLSKEMESLSFKDRNLIQEEIHGVTNLCPEENPQMMQQALQEMQEHLNKIERKPVYDQISPFSYIHTDDFRLRFLRCDLYDCKKAAERLVKFTEYMNEEFDMKVLERPLKLTDLQTKGGKRGKEIMDFFKQGYSQLLPFRDRSGRRVFVTNITALPFDPVLRYKVYQYLLLVGSSDEETQRKGMVIVMWGKGSPQIPDAGGEPGRGRRLMEALPVRVASVHQSFEDTPVLRLLRAVLAGMLLGADKKIRLQCHFEDDWEIRYKLLGFGIPVDSLPYTETNNVKNKYFHQWIKGRRTIEEMEENRRNANDSSPIPLVDCPSSVDVVFKTGTANVRHPGNATYRDLVKANCSEYSSELSNQVSKKTIVDRIIGDVTLKDGRFLEWSTCGCWEVILDQSRLRVKIINSLYHCQKTLNAKSNVQTNTSSTYLFERQDGKKRKRTAGETDERSCMRLFVR